MFTLGVLLIQVEFIAFPIVALLLGFTIYFFIRSKKILRETLAANELHTKNLPRNRRTTEEVAQPAVKKELSQRPLLREQPIQLRQQQPVEAKTSTPFPSRGNLAQDLKQSISQQQQILDSYLEKVESLENEGREELQHENQQLSNKITSLIEDLEIKDEEIKNYKQEVSAAQAMANKIEEVYKEFDVLQEKMQSLEKQAARANSLAMELDDAQNSYEQVHRELQRKQEKLEEIIHDNQQMKTEMNSLEDKLSESNLQRQQLNKKVQFLQDINNDLQSLSDTNKRLQTEIRRIGELESMLNLMVEERDFLLRKKSGL